MNDRLPVTYRGKALDGFRRIEGPVYVDRVGGKLTFRDWDSWYPEDQEFFREIRRPAGGDQA